MEFSIEPLVAVGVIRFGMTPEQVRQSVGRPFELFKRSEDTEHPSDHFKQDGFFVYYDKSGVVEAAEFVTPNDVQYADCDLLQLPFSDLHNLLLSRDQALEIEADSMTSYSLGIGAYAPAAADDLASKPESVIVFRSGYYD